MFVFRLSVLEPQMHPGHDKRPENKDTSDFFQFGSVLLTWRRPASAAPRFSAEPPSWPSPPQTPSSSPPALCTGPPGSSSSVHGVAPAEDENIFKSKFLFYMFKLRLFSRITTPDFHPVNKVFNTFLSMCVFYKKNLII